MRTLFLLAAINVACATAEDPGGSGLVVRDTGGSPGEDVAPGDSTMRTDTASDTAMTTDSSVADSATSDSAISDSGSSTDTATTDTGTIEIDSGTLDTGSATDTGTTTTCSKSGEYGGKCKTNLDCAAIPKCGYVCCAYDPTGTISLGCGRIAGGSFCLP